MLLTSKNIVLLTYKFIGTIPTVKSFVEGVVALESIIADNTYIQVVRACKKLRKNRRWTVDSSQNV